RHTSDLLLLAIRRPPTPPLFPYTTLFRSCECELAAPRNPTAFGSREHETALEPQRSARAARTVGRGNHFHSRDGRCVQRSRYARDQEGPGVAREDAGKFFCRTEHKNPDLF